jgi:hypothetical protein
MVSLPKKISTPRCALWRSQRGVSNTAVQVLEVLTNFRLQGPTCDVASCNEELQTRSPKVTHTREAVNFSH